MDKLYTAIVANKQKAIVSFVVAAVTAYAAKHGFDIETVTVKEALELIFYGVIGYVGVYVKRNQ